MASILKISFKFLVWVQKIVSRKRQEINANLMLQVKFFRKQAEIELRAQKVYWSNICEQKIGGSRIAQGNP